MRALLLIDADHQRATRLALSLERAGWKVRSEHCGLAALTAIEWSRPDVVVVHAETEGITAVELAATVKLDPTLKEVRMVLIAASAFNERSRSTFDQTIDSEESTEVIAALDGAGPQPPTNRDSATETPEDAPDAPQHGSDPLRLDEIIESLTEAVVTGRLTVSLGDSTTLYGILFDQGQIIHATGGGRVGPEVLSQVLQASERGDGLWYQFDKVSLSVIDRAQRSADPLSLSQICELATSTGDHGTQRIDPVRLAGIEQDRSQHGPADVEHGDPAREECPPPGRSGW